MLHFKLEPRRYWPEPEVFLAGGGGGGGLGSGALPVEPSDFFCGCDGLLGLGMTKEQFREKIWDARFEADYQVRYWALYEYWVNWFQSVIRVILGLSGAASLTGLFFAPEYQFPAAVVGAVAALVATVIMPAFKWDTLEERIIGVRNAWIDVRSGYELVWDDSEDEEIAKLERQFRVWAERQKEIERRSVGLRVVKRFQNKAYQESELLCAK